MSGESDERLPVGPRGEQGVQGERGQRGLSSRTARAIVVLFLFCALGITGCLLWTAHEIAANNQKFCAVVTAATATPVARPASPAANPSREQAWEWYVRYVQLGRSLGC